MPWAERTVVKLRKDFVLKALSKEAPMTELCREYGISRKTGYKWLERFRVSGFDGLTDETRRPASSPLRTTAEATLAIIQLRKAHPTWGPRKVQRLLEKKMPKEQSPSVRTIARILARCQMVRWRKRRPFDRGWSLQRKRRFVVVEQPNDLWTVDFKGWWRTGDGRHCEPLTIRDAFSRYVLALRILPATNGDEVRPVFEELFERHGLPKVIQSDNGPPFAATSSLCGLTKLSAWWLSLGIEVVRSRPGCPQDNGGHERMHADIRVELQADAAASLEAQQAACDEWRVEFNHVRPHDALGLKTPADVYVTSERRMSHIVMGGYFPDGCEVILIDSRGGFSYLGQKVFVSKALVRAQVGLERVGVGGEFRVWFHRQLLGFIRPVEGAPEVPVTPYPEPDLPPVVTLSVGATVTGGDTRGDSAGDTSRSPTTAPSTAAREGSISNAAVADKERILIGQFE